MEKNLKPKPIPPHKPPPRKKMKFKDIKKNTINSLNEVEYFLNNFNRLCDTITIFKILKKR